MPTFTCTSANAVHPTVAGQALGVSVNMHEQLSIFITQLKVSYRNVSNIWVIYCKHPQGHKVIFFISMVSALILQNSFGGA